MPVPWLRLLDAALSLGDIARSLTRPPSPTPPPPAATDTAMLAQPPGGALEARLTGVVVAALKEAFDRDHQRLQLERDQRESERQRAEKLLRVELRRQAGEREIGRLRWLAGTALTGWLATLIVAGLGGALTMPSRVALGVGWVLLLAALASALLAQSRLTRGLTQLNQTDDPAILETGSGGDVAVWLLVAALAAVGASVLLR